MGRHKGQKMYFRRIVAFRESDKITNRGNPEYYIFTLECGHEVIEYYKARSCVNAFSIEVIIPSVLKKGKKITEKMFPRMHCHQCASNKPPTLNVDLKKYIQSLNSIKIS